MAGSRTALFALLILVVLVAVDWLFQSSSTQASRDAADLVYCMAPAHQSGLVNSAESLNLVDSGSSPSAIHVSGSVMPLAEWRSEDDADFQRACQAYATPAFASGGSSGGGTGGLLGILLSATAGALLTLTIDELKQGSDRRWAQADGLRESWSAFRGALEAYAEERRKPDLLPEGDIGGLRRDLVTRLRAIQSQHRRSPTVASLKGQLTTQPAEPGKPGEPGRLSGSGIAAGWAKGISDDAFGERRERARQIVGYLDEFDSSLQMVAGKLEHRIWLSWRL